MPIQFTNGRFQALNSDGTPMVGGKLHTYVSGTTTNQPTYTDATLTVPNTNPIILNGRGEASVWLAALVYSFALADANDVPVWTDDGVDGDSGGGTSPATGLPLSVTQDPFDADPTGVVDAVAAFQAAVNSTTDGTVVVIEVPPGTYKGDFTVLAYGSRAVLFFERGGVAYSVAAPTCARQNFYSAGDGRIWQAGYFGMQLSPKGTTGEAQNLRIQRDVAYSGGTASNPSALSVKTNITGANNGTKENAIIAECDDSNSNTIVGHSRSALQVAARRKVVNVNNEIAANIFVEDDTGRQSSTCNGALVALEVDVVASGPDNATGGRRYGIDIISAEQAVSADGATGMQAALRIRNQSAAVAGASTWQYGVLCDADYANGGITYAFQANGSPTALLRSRQDNTVLCDLGTNLNTAGPITKIQSSGKNSAGTLIQYASFSHNIVDPTAGSEDGEWELDVRQAGTLVNAMSIGLGVKIGNPTGGYKGQGTVNVATDIYKNNTAYANPDYVFEHAYTGKVERFADNEGARTYRGLLTLEEVEQITRDTYKLPGMDNEPLGAFGRVDRLLQLVEEAYLHLFQERRARKSLEARLDKAGL